MFDSATLHIRFASPDRHAKALIQDDTEQNPFRASIRCRAGAARPVRGRRTATPRHPEGAAERVARAPPTRRVASRAWRPGTGAELHGPRHEGKSRLRRGQVELRFYP